MARHFIAVGGSGQHAALAFADLAVLVHHLRQDPLDATHFYILDRDQTSVSSQTAWQLAQAQIDRMRKADVGSSTLWPSPDPTHSALPPGRDLSGETVADVVSNEYGPLYFTEDQLKVKYRLGYFGQAPVAAAFLGDTLRGEARQQGTAVQTILADSARRVVIAGSMVGGTGAGCLPRLVQFFSERQARTANDGGTNVMSLVFLRWYKLASEKNGAEANVRNAEMQQREPSALLFAERDMKERSATVLVGHPAIDRDGTPRPWAGDTQQPAHENLSLPLYAAAVASNFLYSARPLQRGIYSIVCPDPKPAGLVLSSDISLFGAEERHALNDNWLELGRLARLNYDFCERLRWALTYIEQRPNAGMSLFGTSLRVPLLDDLAQRLGAAERESFLAGLRALLDAKWQAMVRLSKSTPGLFGDARTLASSASAHFAAPSIGLQSLREWTSLGSIPAGQVTPGSLSRVLVSGLTPTSLPAAASAHRLLPPVVDNDTTAAVERRCGTLDSMSPHAFQQIIDTRRVVPRSLPTTKTLEFFLQQSFDGALRRGRAAPPSEGETEPREGEVTEEETWSQRWRLLLLGLCGGAFTLEAASIDSGAVKLSEAPPQFFIKNSRGHVLGWTSPQTLLVPAVTANWEAAEADAPNEFSDAQRAVLAWFLLLEQLKDGLTTAPGGLNAPVASPAWFTANIDWAHEAAQKLNVAPSFGLLPQPLTLNWGADQPASLPFFLPVVGAPTDFVFEQLLHFFNVSVFPLSLDDPRLPAALAPLRDESLCPTYEPMPQANATRPELHKVVWAAKSPQLARLLQFGFALVPDGGGRPVAYTVADQRFSKVEVLTEEDVKLRAVTPLGGNQDRSSDRFPDFPVKLRYSGLINLSERPTCVQTSGGSARYTFSLRGLGQVHASPSVIEKRKGTFLLWPKFRSSRTRSEAFKAYFTLADSTGDADSIVYVGVTKPQASAQEDRINWSVRLKCVVSAQPLYEIRNGEFARGGVPELMTVVDHGGAQEGIGLFQTALIEAAELGTERWGIDFGTSSSVVAASGGTATQSHVLKSDGALDQTLTFAQDRSINVESCHWFPTWDAYAPRTRPAQPMFPSQLVLKDGKFTTEVVRQSRAEDEPYGRTFVVDHGGVLSNEYSSHSRIRGKLKWIEAGDSQVQKEAQRALRRAYLIHLLELAYTLRAEVVSPVAGLARGLPLDLQATFTMPLQMREEGVAEDAASTLAQDVDHVCRLLGKLTGCRITPLFQWESHAGTPPQEIRAFERVYAVADLGGGSLDMWGAIQGMQREFADSYRFGGHDLLTQWARLRSSTDAEQEVANLKRKIQTEPRDVLEELRKAEVEQSRQIQVGYFEAAIEAVVRWVAGLAVEAARSGQRDINVSLSLLGMGWSLNMGFERNPSEFAERMGTRTQAFLDRLAKDHPDETHLQKLRLKVELLAGHPEAHERKTYLAMNAAVQPGRPIQTLRSVRTASFLGFDLQTEVPSLRRRDRLPWYRQTNLEVSTHQDVRIVFQHGADAAQPLPALPVHTINPRDLTQLVKRINDSTRGTTPVVYNGQSPIGMVLDLLRHNSEPSQTA